MYSLAIQNNYDEVQFALMQDTTQIQYDSISKMKASTELISHVNSLLATHNLSLSDLSYIAANCGPGPFTTLRVVITTINGIAYATKIPLIGINGLFAAAHEWQDDTYPLTAILFNAFGNDVYALVMKQNKQLMYGAYAITDLLLELKNESGTIRFLGNGTTLHKNLIASELGSKAYIPETIPAYCSLEAIARMGYEEWSSKQSGVSELMPVYLKQHPAVR